MEPLEEESSRRALSCFRPTISSRDSRDDFPDIETDDLFSQATLLDPRFKKNGFSSTSSADEAFETLVKYAEEIELNQSSSSVTQVLVDPAPADDGDEKNYKIFKKSMS